MKKFLLMLLCLLITPAFSVASEKVSSSHPKVSDSRAVEANSTPTPSEMLQVLSDGTIALREGAIKKIPEDQRDAALRQLNNLNHKIINGELPFFDQETIDKGNYSAICFCEDNCCDLGICCASGFWLFCWSYGVC